MRQLDLFGSLFDTPPPAEKKKEPKPATASPKKETQPPVENFSIEQYSLLQQGLADNEAEMSSLTATLVTKEEVETKPNPVFYTDGKIGVKLKAKPATASNPQTRDLKIKKGKTEKILQKRGRKSFKEIDAEADLIEVPDDEVLFSKQYYPIREVAKWFNVNTSLLRFWENEFDILKPRKNRKGDRMFRPEDVKNIHLIYQLLRQRKYTVDGAKDYIKSHRQQADTQLHLTQTLTRFRNFLLDLKANLGTS